MKRALALLSLFALVAALPAAEIFRLDFDNTAGDVTFPYPAGTGDIIPVGWTINLNNPTAGSDPGTPEWVADATSPQGDGAVLAVDGTDGLIVTASPAWSGSYTVEALFRSDIINPGAEWELQQVVGNDAWNANNQWAIRIDGTGVTNGFTLPGILQGMTNGTAGEHNVSTASAISFGATAWHHVAITYDHGTGTVELFFDGASEGTSSPVTYSTGAWDIFSIGFWMNDASSDRHLRGAIDSVVIHDTVVAPAGFSLPVELSVFSTD